MCLGTFSFQRCRSFNRSQRTWANKGAHNSMPTFFLLLETTVSDNVGSWSASSKDLTLTSDSTFWIPFITQTPYHSDLERWSTFATPYFGILQQKKIDWSGKLSNTPVIFTQYIMDSESAENDAQAVSHSIQCPRCKSGIPLSA